MIVLHTRCRDYFPFGFPRVWTRSLKPYPVVGIDQCAVEIIVQGILRCGERTYSKKNKCDEQYLANPSSVSGA